MCSAGRTFSLNDDPCGFYVACFDHWPGSWGEVKDGYEKAASYSVPIRKVDCFEFRGSTFSKTSY
jgi:hypothetical protein